jgi:hypothetical protein
MTDEMEIICKEAVRAQSRYWRGRGNHAKPQSGEREVLRRREESEANAVL